MKIGRLFSDLLAALGRSASPETGFALALKRLIALTGARAGALRFEPGRGAVLDMIVGARKASPLAGWLTARLDEPTRGIRLSRLGEPPPGWSGRQLAVLLRTTLGDAASPAGSLVLIGPGGRRGLGASTIPAGFPREFGLALAQAWRLQQRTLRLEQDSRRRERETQALLKAARAVNQSLEVGETVRLILNQAREVLGVQSCGLFTLDAATGELSLAASLDLDPASHGAIRVRVGEGITGAAVQERRPVQSPDVFTDPRVRYPQLQAESGLRSMLAAPLILGEDAIGALTVLRQDVHHFTAEEESLLSAFADQAAMALEHARLFSSVRTYSEQLEAMVTARTRELDDQKRFVEVVLETLPLGLFVLDAGLRIVSVNREGAALLPAELGAPGDFLELLPPTKASTIRELLEAVLADRQVRRTQEDLPRGAAALAGRRDHPRPGPGGGHHAAAAPRAADAAHRAAHHGRPAGRRRGPRAQQSTGHHRRLRRGAQGTRGGARPPRPRRLQGLPDLPLGHRGRGVPLQGDHGQPPAVRARPGQPPRGGRSQCARGEGARTAQPSIALRREPPRDRPRSGAARRRGQ